MKTALIHLLVLAAAASHAAYGYTISPLPSNRRKSRVMPSGKSQTDVIEPTKAIKQAIEATKSFGATSSKARIAWEVVEKIEMPRKRSSKRSKKKLLGGVVADNGGAEEKSEIMPMVIDEATFGVVEDNMSDLKVLLDDEMAKVRHLKNMANKIKELRTKSSAIRESKSMEAIVAAQEAVKEHGFYSSQTVSAWEAFEDIISDDLAP